MRANTVMPLALISASSRSIVSLGPRLLSMVANCSYPRTLSQPLRRANDRRWSGRDRSPDGPVSRKEGADRNADNVVDPLVGRGIAGIEEERSQNRGKARIQELGRCHLAILDRQNSG